MAQYKKKSWNKKGHEEPIKNKPKKAFYLLNIKNNIINNTFTVPFFKFK